MKGEGKSCTEVDEPFSHLQWSMKARYDKLKERATLFPYIWKISILLFPTPPNEVLVTALKSLTHIRSAA